MKYYYNPYDNEVYSFELSEFENDMMYLNGHTLRRDSPLIADTVLEALSKSMNAALEQLSKISEKINTYGD